MNQQFLAADKKVCIFDSSSGSQVATLEGEHSLGVNDCVWVTDNIIGSGSDDQTIKMWDIEKVAHIYLLSHFLCCL